MFDHIPFIEIAYPLELVEGMSIEDILKVKAKEVMALIDRRDITPSTKWAGECLIEKHWSLRRKIREQKLEVDNIAGEINELVAMTGLLVSKLKSVDELVNMVKIKKSEDVLFAFGDFAGQTCGHYKQVMGDDTAFILKTWEEISALLKSEEENLKAWIGGGRVGMYPSQEMTESVKVVALRMKMHPDEVAFDIHLYGTRCDSAHNGINMAINAKNWHKVAYISIRTLENLHNILPPHLYHHREAYKRLIRRFLNRYFLNVQKVADEEKIGGWDVAIKLRPEYDLEPLPQRSVEPKQKTYKQKVADRAAAKRARRDAKRDSSTSISLNSTDAATSDADSDRSSTTSYNSSATSYRSRSAGSSMEASEFFKSYDFHTLF